MRHLRRHADALTQRRVGVDGFADVHRICAHLDSQRDLANHVARVGTDHAAARVGLGRAGDDTGVEGAGGEIFVALQFTGNNFGVRMQWWRCSTSAMALNQARADSRRFRPWPSSSKD